MTSKNGFKTKNCLKKKKKKKDIRSKISNQELYLLRVIFTIYIFNYNLKLTQSCKVNILQTNNLWKVMVKKIESRQIWKKKPKIPIKYDYSAWNRS